MLPTCSPKRWIRLCRSLFPVPGRPWPCISEGAESTGDMSSRGEGVFNLVQGHHLSAGQSRDHWSLCPLGPCPSTLRKAGRVSASGHRARREHRHYPNPVSLAAVASPSLSPAPTDRSPECLCRCGSDGRSPGNRLAQLVSEGAGVYGAFHLGARRAGQAPISLTPARQVGLRLRVQDAESQAGRRAAVSAGRGGRVSHPRS